MKHIKSKEKAGDFLLDIAKLIIGGVILAGLMQQNIESYQLYIYGGFAALLFILWGFFMIRLTEKEKEDKR